MRGEALANSGSSVYSADRTSIDPANSATRNHVDHEVLNRPACLFDERHANTRYHQLRAFNPYWEQHRARQEGLTANTIGNNVDYVQAHLAEVLGVLADAETGHLTAEQLRMRRELVEVLQGYAVQGLFPTSPFFRSCTPMRKMTAFSYTLNLSVYFSRRIFSLRSNGNRTLADLDQCEAQ